ncbi:MAG: hypothetical protein ACYCOR_12195 [Acidobacteriaceae bacterium]
MFFLLRRASGGWIAMLAVATFAGIAGAQTTPSQPSVSPAIAQQTIGHLDISATAEKIQVAGAVTLTGDSTLLGNGSTVTAGKVTLPIHLTRGGQLDLCATTTVHLSQQYNAADANSPLMVALDHGAIEAHYKVGKNSDVVLTPDLRILLSGPGQADVRIRLNDQGDTCVANRGDNAPYVTVSEQMGAGVYRVMPNQRVTFEHGSVRNVVDNEPQPCGCPVAPAVSVASAGVPAEPGKAVAKPGEAVAAKAIEQPMNPAHPDGPSSTPADTAFPLAESEGLAPPPAAPTKPVVAPGETLSEVTTTLSYTAPQQTVPTGTPSGMATPESAATVASAPAPGFGPSVNTGPVAVAEAPPVPRPKPQHKSGFFHKIGHFFAKIFG